MLVDLSHFLSVLSTTLFLLTSTLVFVLDCDKKHSSILIHQLSSAAAGKYNELKTEVDNLSVFMKSVKNIYLENTNIDPETLEQLLSTDIWLDSETCSAYGLVDNIIH